MGNHLIIVQIRTKLDMQLQSYIFNFYYFRLWFLRTRLVKSLWSPRVQVLVLVVKLFLGSGYFSSHVLVVRSAQMKLPVNPAAAAVGVFLLKQDDRELVLQAVDTVWIWLICSCAFLSLVLCFITVLATKSDFSRLDDDDLQRCWCEMQKCLHLTLFVFFTQQKWNSNFVWWFNLPRKDVINRTTAPTPRYFVFIVVVAKVVGICPVVIMNGS